MDKRYQIFVSSTFEDLKDERQAVIKGILEMEHIPAGMELFPATDDDAWKLICEVIDDSDYYVLVIGGRYGSLDEAGLGYTQKEYEYAMEKKVPVIALLHKSPDNLPRDKTETDPAAWEKLKSFRKLVEKQHTCKKWETATELQSLVISSLTSAFRRHPRVGWIKASEVSSITTAIELSELKNNFQKAMQFISGLEHCTKFCADRADSWTFGDEYELIKGREAILNKASEIFEAAEASSEVLFISAGFNISDNAWKTLLKRIDEIEFKVIINEDGINVDAQKLVNIVSNYTVPRWGNSFGIRMLLVKGKEGYICNSTSVANGGMRDSYWSIYSKHPSTLKIMEIVFNYLWVEAKPQDQMT